MMASFGLVYLDLPFYNRRRVYVFNRFLMIYSPISDDLLPECRP